MAIRMNDLRDFKGKRYITEVDLDNALHAEDGGLLGKDGNLKPELNPIRVLSMQNPGGEKNPGERVDKKDEDFSKLKFIGNCKVMYGEDGLITIRVGENVNSSNWTLKDGTTDGTISAANTIPAASSYTLPADAPKSGTEVALKKNGGNTVTVNSNGATHFDDSADNYFIVKLVKNGAVSGTYYSDKITGDVPAASFHGSLGGSDKIAGISLKISGWQKELKWEQGATGKQATATVKLDVDTLLSGDTDSVNFDFIIIHHNGSEGEYTWTGKHSFVWIGDIDTKPSIGTVTVNNLTLNSPVLESGVDHIRGAKVTVTVTEIANLYNPVGLKEDKEKVIVTGTGCASGSYKKYTDLKMANTNRDSLGSISSDYNVNSGNVDNVQVSVTAKNLNGEVVMASSALPVNTYIENGAAGYVNESASWGTGPYMKSARLKDDCTTSWNSAWDLTTAEAMEGLQVDNKNIVYPKYDYSQRNDKGNGAPTHRPNYKLCKGTRSYVTKITRSGTMPGGAIKVSHSAGTIGSAITNGTIVFQISKGAKGEDGNLVWYNVGRGSTAGGLNITTANCKDENTAYTCDFSFPDGGSKNFFYFRVKMDSAITSISNIELL